MDFAITFAEKSALPLHKQLYEELRRAILSGRLQPGQRIPSSRALACSLHVSRTTVTQCYDELISEGYLEALQGSGTFVCRRLPEQLLRTSPIGAIRSARRATKRGLRLSTYGNRIVCRPKSEPANQNAISFRHSGPDFTQFPLRQWTRLVARHARSGHRAMFDYAENTLGEESLRKAIARYLARARAVKCEPSQVIVCGGSQRALDLVTRVLIDRGDVVALEDPGYLGARQIFLAQGARLRPIPVDESGMVIEVLRREKTKKPKLVYVTPSHQFPSGALLSLSRRLELLAWAGRQGAFIIEDDYDSEYRYSGRPVPALQGLDQLDRVIYVGTFSNVLFPALRLGYMVVPQALTSLLSRAKWLVDRGSPILEQRALADFIDEGHLERHIRRMRTLYEKRRSVLVASLAEHLGDCVTLFGENAGMHLMVGLDARFGDEELMNRATQSGVELASARPCYLRRKPRGEFIFCFAGLSEKKIQEGVKRLALALHLTAG